MTITRTTTIRCDGNKCKATFMGPPAKNHDAHGTRQLAAVDGWRYSLIPNDHGFRVVYDHCPQCKGPTG